MIKEIFAVYDSKAEVYSTPMFMRNKGEALRSWADICNDDKAVYNKHPQDYSLFHIGTFSETTGEIIPLATPSSLGLAQEFTRKE